MYSGNDQIWSRTCIKKIIESGRGKAYKKSTIINNNHSTITFYFFKYIFSVTRVVYTPTHLFSIYTYSIFDYRGSKDHYGSVYTGQLLY